jgi:hypothetical protein
VRNWREMCSGGSTVEGSVPAGTVMKFSANLRARLSVSVVSATGRGHPS